MPNKKERKKERKRNLKLKQSESGVVYKWCTLLCLLVAAKLNGVAVPLVETPLGDGDDDDDNDDTAVPVTSEGKVKSQEHTEERPWRGMTSSVTNMSTDSGKLYAIF